MKRGNALALGAGLIAVCLLIEIATWGFSHGLEALGVIILLVLPAAFVSPRRNPGDRIWLIAAIVALCSWIVSRVIRALNVEPPSGGVTGPAVPMTPPPPPAPAGGGGAEPLRIPAKSSASEPFPLHDSYPGRDHTTAERD